MTAIPVGQTIQLSLGSAQWLFLQLIYQPEGQLQSCLACFPLWFVCADDVC